MKINTRARYALRLMIDMANNLDVEGPMNLGEISKRQRISKRYLGQIVVSLRNRSLVKGMPGKSGGYVLARKPDDISVGEIVQAVIGPISIVDCVTDPDFCMKSDYCECRPVYLLVNQRITDALEDFSLADIAANSQVLSKAEEDVASDGDSYGTDMCSTYSK